MFIQELAQLTGVSTKTIRYYESIGLLPPPQRAANKYREYARAAVDRLRVIASARRYDARFFGGGEITQHAVGRAPHLEGARELEHLAL